MKFTKLSLIPLAVLLVSGCSAPLHVGAKAKPTNILTGLPGSIGPVLAVKIDDTSAAHPQVGLEAADVIYIEQVEGGLTRLAAIYSQYPNRIPAQIGPVRSARISDLDILAQYGHVGFAFSGAQSKFYPKITAANLENISADREPATIYSRDPARSAPTDMMLDPAKLLDKTINTEGRHIDTVKSVFNSNISTLFMLGVSANVGYLAQNTGYDTSTTAPLIVTNTSTSTATPTFTLVPTSTATDTSVPTATDTQVPTVTDTQVPTGTVVPPTDTFTPMPTFECKGNWCHQTPAPPTPTPKHPDCASGWPLIGEGFVNDQPAGNMELKFNLSGWQPSWSIHIGIPRRSTESELRS